jgi:hypothetical protein
MSFIDDAMKWTTEPFPGATVPDDVSRKLDAMPVKSLAARWQELQCLGLKDQTEENWKELVYFDHLPHRQPERGFEMVLEVLRAGAEDALLLELGRRMFATLVNRHAALLVDRIEQEARTNEKLRWLLGGVYWWATEDSIKTRLAAVADEHGWRAAEDTHARRTAPISFQSMSVAELARAWVEQHSKSNKDRDDNWHALRDHESELLKSNPDQVIDLILEILKIEQQQSLLGLLAAGLLEDVISMDTIDRIEREANADDKFRWLLGGVWYWNEPEPLKARLDAIVQGRHWDN